MRYLENRVSRHLLLITFSLKYCLIYLTARENIDLTPCYHLDAILPMFVSSNHLIFVDQLRPNLFASWYRIDPEYRNLENLLNHAVNNVDLPEIPDGYGLTISEFLGNDMAGCSSVQGDISNLQAEMPFHSAEV